LPVTNVIVQDLFTGIDLTGVLANAMLGGVVAREERLHPVGFITLAILSGLGGGLIRDALLQHGTPVALTNPAYIPTALIGAAIAFFVPVGGRLGMSRSRWSMPWRWAAGRRRERRRPWRLALRCCPRCCWARLRLWAGA